ncbi:hypothetical protein O6H91_06G115200 [Diphasiastrum complanatum]|uniref:Uncharacterized protein n=1 Tax=Diphasiastrum complanatum TaxID=34168 RepID=A0ACC2DI48_DIPCM|nr:hypothetical protein O6H91_06G115200 [Diphasiastrum complanatum]
MDHRLLLMGDAAATATEPPSLSGFLKIEHIAGKSVATRVFAKYPLKFLIPLKAASSTSDVIWIYAITYGGGYVSGDSISCQVDVGLGCTTVLTTQASTKVYKSVEGKFSEQLLKIGSEALFALLPDPVTCFSSAKYKQLQTFSLDKQANLVLVDWLTSGRRDCGEVWAFESYRSTNQILLDGETPILLDTMQLDQGAVQDVNTRLKGCHVIAMLVIYGPQLSDVSKQVQRKVKLLAGDTLKIGIRRRRDGTRGPSNLESPCKFFASCSTFGPSDCGILVRLAATKTEQVYEFLREALTALVPLVGTLPYIGK